MFLVVVEVFADFLKHQAAVADASQYKLSVIECESYLILSNRQVFVLDSMKPSRTSQFTVIP